MSFVTAAARYPALLLAPGVARAMVVSRRDPEHPIHPVVLHARSAMRCPMPGSQHHSRCSSPLHLEVTPPPRDEGNTSHAGCHGEGFRRTHGRHLGRVARRMMAAIEVCRKPVPGGRVVQSWLLRLARCSNRVKPGRPGCWRCSIPMSSPSCPRRQRRSHSRTSAGSTQYCSVPQPKRCGTSTTIPRPAQQHTCTCGCCTSGGAWLGWS